MHYAEVNCCVVLSVEGAVLMVNVYVDVMEWDGSHHPFVSLHGKPYQSWSSHMCTIGELLPVHILCTWYDKKSHHRPKLARNSFLWHKKLSDFFISSVVHSLFVWLAILFKWCY
jgi:hypothetical protein